MKYSIYNNIVELTEQISVIYNSQTDKYVFTSRQISLNEDPNKLSIKMQKIFLQAGIIVPMQTEEYLHCITQAKEIENSEKWFHLIVNPTINCNFKCWYCYENHYPSQMLPKTVLSVEKLIEHSIKKHDNIRLSFFGGEPLLYYKQVMSPIINQAYEIVHKNRKRLVLDITSNGYLLSDKIITELKKFPELTFQITLDGGPSVHNNTRFVSKKKGSYQKIIENIQKLVQNGIKVLLRINCTKANIISVRDIPLSMASLTQKEKSLIHVDMQKVWQETEDIEVEIEKAMEIFKERGFKTSHKLLGDYCYGDIKNSAMVNYNGDVYKCTAVDFANTERDGYLSDNGLIVWENDSLNRRLSAKFTNKPCQTCRIFPLCHGGCSKHSIQSKGEDYCVFGFSESKKNKFIQDRLLYNIRYNTKFKVTNIK